jgi:hypothetical protein
MRLSAVLRTARGVPRISRANFNGVEARGLLETVTKLCAAPFSSLV